MVKWAKGNTRRGWCIPQTTSLGGGEKGLSRYCVESKGETKKGGGGKKVQEERKRGRGTVIGLEG